MQLCLCLAGTVKGMVLHGSKVLGVKVDNNELPADAVLIALGPWSDHARSWFPKANLPEVYGMRAHSVVVRHQQAPPQALFLPNDMGEVNLFQSSKDDIMSINEREFSYDVRCTLDRMAQCMFAARATMSLSLKTQRTSSSQRKSARS